jgi:hypothetical protein
MMGLAETSLCACCQRACWRWVESLRECTGWQHRPSWVSGRGCGHKKKWAAERATRWEEAGERDSWARAGSSGRGRQHWANGKPGPTFTERWVVYGRWTSWDCFCSGRHCDDARAWRIIGQEGGSGRAERSAEGRSEDKSEERRRRAGERVGQAQSRVFFCSSEQSGCFKNVLSASLRCFDDGQPLSSPTCAGRAFRLGADHTSFGIPSIAPSALV